MDRTKLELATDPKIQIDSVTGIENRAAYDEAIRRFAAEANADHPLSLVLIDIDHFKRFNDTYGHSVGDAVLKSVAFTVERAVAGKGNVFRYGGEEIVVLLPNHSCAEGAAVAERLRSSIERIEITDIDAVITASLGVSTMPQISAGAAELFNHADRAMYASKDAGRNLVTSASPDTAEMHYPPTRRTSRNHKPNIRVRLTQGVRQLYMLETTNFGAARVEIEQIDLLHEGIRLMGSVIPPPESLWFIEPDSTAIFQWIPSPDPATSLMRMDPNRELTFSTHVEFAVSVSVGGHSTEYRQKLAVRVEGMNAQITQLAG